VGETNSGAEGNAKRAKSDAGGEGGKPKYSSLIWTLAILLWFRQQSKDFNNAVSSR